MKQTLIVVIFFLWIFNLKAGNPKRIVYYQNDSVRLEMDIYIPVASVKDSSRPLFIYVHGGGFASGNRSDGYKICKYLADKGFVSATISYTLYMKDKSFSCDGVVSEKIKAIRYGVNDLWLATEYLIDHKDEYGIATSKIFIGGCSAGAETVLQAAFWDYDLMNWSDKKLPDGFKYAGVIAGAGAIMDINLITRKNLLPVMMFHGTCDNLVPYGTAAHHFCKTDASGWLMFFGSYTIYEQVLKLGGSVSMNTYCNGGHEYANYLFENDLEIAYSFMLEVLQGLKTQHHSVIETGKQCDQKESPVHCP
ncbi:MAG TPA: alpha/beta hydrolase [Lentimicrobium sp.]|nr:alpha/beta hydrolase [Lentimicrobium sp.]